LNFWEKPLTELSKQEWESLCDGCARCCLHKLEDEETGEVHYTSVVCKYLNETSCQCTNYQDRHSLAPDCIWLNPDNVEAFKWLPGSCAYRLRAEGKPLHWWHPLVSGRVESVQEAGMTIRGKCISEEHVHPDHLQENIIHWVKQ